MKQITFSLLLALMLSLAATAAIATPQYHGPTTAGSDFNIGSKAGFYIWNDVESSRDWSVRWHAAGADSDRVAWKGDISFFNSTLQQAAEFSFSDEDKLVTGLEMGQPFLRFESYTNNTTGVDGLDFTLAGGYEVLIFELHSSLFEGTGAVLDDDGLKSDFIFIGEGLKQPNVLINGSSEFPVHRFEVKVPEPGTLALLGLGLLGLTLTRRRAA